MSELELPLFPLNTVLFPEGPLPLRIFEPRYVDMVSECLRHDTGFGVCLIQSGGEIGKPAEVYPVGTLARITDWHERHDGLLGITSVGEQRVRILERWVRRDHLTVARAELIPAEPVTELPPEYIPMADFLRQLVKQIPHLYANVTIKYGDASWVGNRLAELMPLHLTQKQTLLELNEPIQRLERLRRLMETLDIRY
jgi:hypothetical protein